MLVTYMTNGPSRYPQAKSIGGFPLLGRGARVEWTRGRPGSPLPTQRRSSAMGLHQVTGADRKEKVMTFCDLLSMAPDPRLDKACSTLCVTFLPLKSVHLNLRNSQANRLKPRFCAQRKQKLSHFSPSSGPALESSLINWETHSKNVFIFNFSVVLLCQSMTINRF